MPYFSQNPVRISPSFCLGFLTATLGILAVPERLAVAAPSVDYNIRLLTDHTPDLTDIDRYLHSITAQYSTPQEQAIAIWRWSQRMRKQTTNPIEGGQFVLDPIRLFNSFGFCNCGIISGVNDALWLRMGWKAHYVQLGDHTVTECSWDDGKTWHMFDSSMSFYCFNDRGEVASVAEIEKNPRFYLENYAPECGTNPARDVNDQQAWRSASDRPVGFQRTLANGYDSFKPPNDIEDTNMLAQWGDTYVLNLRPDESYTRNFRHADGNGPQTFRPVNGSKDPDANNNIRANGVWHYAPNLHDPAAPSLIYSSTGVTWTKEGAKGPGEVVFKVSAANVVTSAKFSVAGTGAALALSPDAGIHWEKLALDAAATECVKPIAGLTEYLAKVTLTGADSLLTAFTADTLTQVNRTSLPKLVRGPNRIQLSVGPQVETIQFQPSIVGDTHKTTAFEDKAIDVEHDSSFYKPTLRPAENNTPCYVTWKIETPTPIVDCAYGGTVCVKAQKDRVTLLHSWNGANYSADYEKTDDSKPNDLMVTKAVTDPPAGARSAYFRYEFETARYAKNYFAPGVQMARMTIRHTPKTSGFAPLEITYCWVEHRDTGDIERQHTELVESAPHEYTLNVGGFRDPTMQWIRMRLAAPGGEKPVYGYSDGQDVGPSALPVWQHYVWGKNLALGKSYQLEGQQDERNLDAGHDLTDGIIAPPDTDVSVKYMPTNVMFTSDVSPTVTIDLGSAQTAAAVRVFAGQEGGFHLSYPDEITVETSLDGQTYTRAGSAPFKQVFEPPSDYVPWELEDAPQFDSLPAGGRLAYAYRVLFEKPFSARYVRVKCQARKGWGMLLSEVQVLDAVTIIPGKPLVVLSK